MTKAARDTVVFDLGGVLIDWDPRHLYRKLFAGDEVAMEHFLATICTHEWNRGQDAGRTDPKTSGDFRRLVPEMIEPSG
jgi:2-haloacid dehalogenase